MDTDWLHDYTLPSKFTTENAEGLYEFWRITCNGIYPVHDRTYELDWHNLFTDNGYKMKSAKESWAHHLRGKQWMTTKGLYEFHDVYDKLSTIITEPKKQQETRMIHDRIRDLIEEFDRADGQLRQTDSNLSEAMFPLDVPSPQIPQVLLTMMLIDRLDNIEGRLADVAERLKEK